MLSARGITNYLSKTAGVLLAVFLAAGAWLPISQPVQAAGGADFIVEGITLYPAEPSLGDSVLITVTVKNQGTETAPGTYISCHVDASVIGNKSITSLGPGLSTSVTFTWQTIAGSHTVKATADANGTIPESNETNNVLTYTFTPIAPDLTVENISWSPSTPSEGDSVAVSATIRNSGNIRSKASTVRLFIDGVNAGYQNVSLINPGNIASVTFDWVATPGQHEIRAVVDETDSNVESNESNNEAMAVLFTEAPDIVLAGITTIPETISEWDVVTVNITLGNIGTGRAEKSRVLYYIDEQVQSPLPVPAIEPGEETVVAFTWTALSGTHTIRAIADFYDQIIESNETNNEASVEIATKLPDLMIKDVTWTPVQACAGETFTFSVKVKNVGIGRAEPFRLSCLMNEQSQVTVLIPGLEPGQESTLMLYGVALAGTHSITFAVDSGCEIEETDESNNRWKTNLTVVPTDLVISDIVWVPENPDLGDVVTFNVTISNQGAGVAENFYVGYFIDNLSISNTLITSLAAGDEIIRQYSWTATEGRHVFRAIADINSDVYEADEKNNEKMAIIVPNMPDLVIDSVTWSPAEIVPGEEILFSITVKNTGALVADPTRITYTIDGVSAGYTNISRLTAGEETIVQFPWVATDGTHRFDILVDSQNLIREIDETNNLKVVMLPPPDLVVREITWSSGETAIGDTIEFSAVLENTGRTATQPSQAHCVIDGVTIISGDVPEIAAGAQHVQTFVWEAESGPHTVTVIADAVNTVTETDETNNEYETEFVTATPELVLEEVSWWMENPIISEEVTFTAHVTNSGTYATVATTLRYSFDEGEWEILEVPSIAGGESREIVFTAKPGSGEHDLALEIDPDNDVEELDETNNSSTLHFDTTAPDLAVRTIAWTPPTAAPGDEITITVKIENRGISSAPGTIVSLVVDGEAIAEQEIQEIGIGEITTVEFPWVAEAGLHEINVFADYGECIAECDEKNNTGSRDIELAAPDTKTTGEVTTAVAAVASEGSFLTDSWWIILLVAAVLGGGAFFALYRSFKKN